MSHVVDVQNATKSYALDNLQVPALKGVTLQINRGEFLAIAGPSGSGKTTLLNLIGCLESPSSGKILLEGQDIVSLTQDQLAELRAHRIGFIFQTFNLLPVLTALENVEYPLLCKALPGEERQKRAQEALRSVGLADFGKHKPMELSGGQRQRVAIARAIVGEPTLILADEPTANLDSTTGHEILMLMHDINQKKGTTFIFSTHDQKVMKQASRIAHIRDGVIVKAPE